MVHGGLMFEEGMRQKGSRGRQPNSRRTGEPEGWLTEAGVTRKGPGFRAPRHEIGLRSHDVHGVRGLLMP